MSFYEELLAKLKEIIAGWQAGENRLTFEQKFEETVSLGVVVDEASLAEAMAPHASSPGITKFESEVDWRSRHHSNHVTSIKDRGSCGSCVSFAIVAVVESMASIEQGQELDLSEADLHFCSIHGANCLGWWPDCALDTAKNQGVPDEEYFLYNSAFKDINSPECHHSPDRDIRTTKVQSWGTISDINDRKNWLTSKGLCCAVMMVYEDFQYYSQGIYKHVSGEFVERHCVQVIGYSESEQCWICKNSWGDRWRASRNSGSRGSYW